MAQKPKALVTGGGGFIGSHLVDRLLADGHAVTVLDNYAVGRPENLAHQADNPALTMIEGDIRALEDVERAMEGCGWVFHLAALADIVPSIQNPRGYHQVNVDGTFNVCEVAKTNGIKRFLYAASSSCYGIPDAYPTPESSEIRPMYPYALTKYMGECIVNHWGQTYELPTVCLRLFNVYGPRVRTAGTYGAVFGVFLAQKLAGQAFTVVGDGSQTRDFTFVTDVADAFVKAAGSNIAGKIMNVGSGGTYSVNRLVELLEGPVEYIPKRPGEPDCTYADTSRIEELLGWHASVPLEDGVKQMLDNIDYWRDAPLWNAESIKAATSDWFKYLGK